MGARFGIESMCGMGSLRYETRDLRLVPDLRQRTLRSDKGDIHENVPGK